jgi:hypothetical protein
MSSEQKPISSSKVFADGWRITKESMSVDGLQVPDTIEFKIDGSTHIRATRVAKLDDLARAIGALDADIERLSRESRRAITVGDEIERLRRTITQSECQDPASRRYANWASEEIERLSERLQTDVFRFLDRPVDELRQDRASLQELQKRAVRSGCPDSSTVIEALFPDVAVRKKTDAERAEDERWLAIRKEEGLKINPETAEVEWNYGLTCNPYGILDEWEWPEEFHQVGREYFARSPGSDIWVHSNDLPDATCKALWKRHSGQLAFPAGLEDFPMSLEEALWDVAEDAENVGGQCSSVSAERPFSAE